MDDMGFVVSRAMRGVRETEEEGRTGEDVGMKSGVELRWGEEDMVGTRRRKKQKKKEKRKRKRKSDGGDGGDAGARRLQLPPETERVSTDIITRYGP